MELIDENGESIATLSVNIPERAHLLGDGEFFAKTWSENEEMAEAALASGIFHDTGRRSDDNLKTQIWKLKLIWPKSGRSKKPNPKFWHKVLISTA